MFQRHASRHLPAFIDGQLGPSEAARVEAHLARCSQCREARARFQFSAGLLREMPRVEAPASIWSSLEAALPPERPAGFLRVSDTRNETLRALGGRARFQYGLLALAAVLVIAAVPAVLWLIDRAPDPWDVVRLTATGGEAPMAIGEWVETDNASRATIRIGAIGTVDVAPNTRMQLLVARADEHRLNLVHGTISAQILAPPRIFFVETPASTVVDLGCAYTMQVDQAGVGVLQVTSGWASLEWGGRESLVPAGASCPTRPEVGPGTPAFDDAPERLREALVAFDFDGGGTGALEIVLAEARARDTLTLWHLLSRVEPGDRPRIFDRFVALTPLPSGVTRDKALALDRETLKLWREELAWTW